MQSTNPAALFQQAVRCFERQDWLQTEALCRQVLLLDPQHADALQMLGLTLSEMGRFQEAVDCLRGAIEWQPQNPVLWTNLGIIYSKARRFADAAESHQRAIQLDAGFAEAYYNLSLADGRLGRFDRAIAAARRATELRPEYASAHFQLAELSRENGALPEAVTAYGAALKLNRDWPEAHYYMGVVLLRLKNAEQALAHFRESLRLEPASIAARQAVGDALMVLGHIEQAKAAYRSAGGGADPLGFLAIESLAELIPPDHEWIDQYLGRVQTALQSFAAAARTIDLSKLHTDPALPSMTLANYSQDARPIMEQYARAIAPHIPRTTIQRRHGKPKLGIVVTRGHERVFSACWGGIVERLSRDLLDVRLVCMRVGLNILQELLAIPKHEYLVLPEPVDEAARLLAEQSFDWLHYWEIGTDWMNYYLPFFRAAPGQSGNWGWPLTSGNENVNSYLSCEQLEPPDGASHYTEQLILLKHLPTYYIPASLRRELSMRSRFGLREDQHVYFCSQRLMKYHPDFDALLAGILRSDEHGLLLMLGHPQASVTNLLVERFRRTMPDVMSRIRVFPRMERQDYLALVAVSDVLLDTLHYGAGANTAYDAAAVGTPLVTLPGEFHRSRWAAAVNRKLGLSQLIASTPEEYVATAIEIASNPDLRQSLRQQILQAGAELFEDTNTVREHDEFFSQAIAATRAN